jgi:hypothetical protein
MSINARKSRQKLVVAKAATGAQVLFDVPSWATRMRVAWRGVGQSGTANTIIQLGVGGVLKNSGYLGSSTRLGTNTMATDQLTGVGWVPYTNPGAPLRVSGFIDIEHVGNNRWVCISNLAREDSTTTYLAGGQNSFDGVVDTLSFTLSAAASFAAGEMVAIFEA